MTGPCPVFGVFTVFEPLGARNRLPGGFLARQEHSRGRPCANLADKNEFGGRFSRFWRPRSSPESSIPVQPFLAARNAQNLLSRRSWPPRTRELFLRTGPGGQENTRFFPRSFSTVGVSPSGVCGDLCSRDRTDAVVLTRSSIMQRIWKRSVPVALFALLSITARLAPPA